MKHVFALACLSEFCSLNKRCLLSRVVAEVQDECDLPQTKFLVSQSILGSRSLWHLYGTCKVLTWSDVIHHCVVFLCRRIFKHKQFTVQLVFIVKICD